MGKGLPVHPAGLGPSESLVGSLCREAARLRERVQRLQGELRCCQDHRLCQRLAREEAWLLARRLELRRMAQGLEQPGRLSDGLALALLKELLHRPLPS